MLPLWTTPESTDKTFVPPRRFLIHDEIEAFGTAKFRIRLWKGRDATPVALVSQVAGGVHPRGHACPLANYINEALLAYPDTGFLSFEDGETLGQRYLVQHIFEYFGNSYRLRLFKPETKPKEWQFLEYVIGSQIER